MRKFDAPNADSPCVASLALLSAMKLYTKAPLESHPIDLCGNLFK
jgi:hypothetical protein